MRPASGCIASKCTRILPSPAGLMAIASCLHATRRDSARDVVVPRLQVRPTERHGGLEHEPSGSRQRSLCFARLAIECVAAILNLLCNGGRLRPEGLPVGRMVPGHPAGRLLPT